MAIFYQSGAERNSKGRNFADVFKYHFVKPKMHSVTNRLSLRVVPRGPTNNELASIQVMVCCQANIYQIPEQLAHSCLKFNTGQHVHQTIQRCYYAFHFYNICLCVLCVYVIMLSQCLIQSDVSGVTMLQWGASHCYVMETTSASQLSVVAIQHTPSNLYYKAHLNRQ